MTDRIVLHDMRFEGRHGVHDWEQTTPQPFEVDVELRLGLQPAGVEDDLTRTIDYSRVYATTRQIVESTTFHLIEALAEAIAHELLAEWQTHAGLEEVVVRVRKPQVKLGGPLAWVGVEIRRRRADA